MVLQGGYSTSYALAAAGINITALPVVLVYVLFQRRFVQGITAGSIRQARIFSRKGRSL